VNQEFDQLLSLMDILLPVFSIGVMLSGIFLFIYLYVKENDINHLRVLFLSVSSFIFIFCTSMIIFFGAIKHNFIVSVQFHRIEQLSTLFMIISFLYYINNIIEPSKIIKKITPFIYSFLILLTVLIVGSAFIIPDSFISITNRQINKVLYEGAFGRGASGPVYSIRDVIMSLSIIYVSFLLIYDIFKRKYFFEHLLNLVGITALIFFSLVDMLFVHIQFHIDFIPVQFSRTTLGVTVFTITMMATSLRKFITNALDVRNAYKMLNETNHRFNQISENINEVFWLTNADFSKILYISHAFEKQWGLSRETLYAFPQGWINSVYHEDVDEVYSIIKSDDPSLRSLFEYRIRKLDGTIVWIRDRWFQIKDNDAKITGWARVTEDITEYKSTESALSYVSYHDSLTQLPNRKAFYEKFEDAIAQAERSDNEKTRVVFFLDLDKFKEVNETLGYDIGDKLLQDVSIRIKECLRKSDYFFRLGGDEFAIVLNKLNKESDAVWVAEKINSAISKPFIIDKHEIFIGISIGICIYPDNGKSIDVLLKNVDTALTQAKREKSKYIFYDKAMNENMIKRKNIENKLRKAIENQELKLFYQPFIDKDMQIIGMEALIRWQNKELGNIPPIDFIYIAEDNGFIIDIGNWALEQACRDINLNKVILSIRSCIIQRYLKYIHLI